MKKIKSILPGGGSQHKDIKFYNLDKFCEICGKVQRKFHVITYVLEEDIQSFCNLCMAKHRMEGAPMIKLAAPERTAPCDRCRNTTRTTTYLMKNDL